MSVLHVNWWVTAQNTPWALFGVKRKGEFRARCQKLSDWIKELYFSQLIWPATRGKCKDEMIRLGVWHIPYSFRDVQGLLLASAQNTEYKAPSSYRTSRAIDRLLSFYQLIKVNFENSLPPPTQVSNPGPSSQNFGFLPLDHSVASLVSSVGRVVAPLTGWYWVRIPVGLALHLISPHPRVCKLWPEWFPTHKQ